MSILTIGLDIESVGDVVTDSRHQARALRDPGYCLFVPSFEEQDMRAQRGTVDRHVAFVNEYRAGANSPCPSLELPFGRSTELPSVGFRSAVTVSNVLEA